MRLLIFCGILLGLLSPLAAQEIGVRAGVDLYHFHWIDEDFWDRSQKFTASPVFGIIFRMPFKDRSAFRTGLFYSDVSNETDQEHYRLSQRFLKLPLQYGFTVVSEEIRSGFFLGPNLGYGLKGEYRIQDTPYNIYKEESVLYKRFFFGFGAGIRAEYLGISLEVQYNFDILIPDAGFGSQTEYALGNEILSVWLGYSYSFAEKPHRYAGRK
jgi:hypothetical protein